MGKYTQYMVTQEIQISPEDENYKDELLSVGQSVQKF